MSSIIVLTTSNILPGLIVSIFIGILNFFLFLLILSNKKLPVGKRFLKFSEKNPKLFLNDLPKAFQDWDEFFTEYEEIVKNYKINYEKITGLAIDNSEDEEEIDREMKPYYIMNDFSELLPKNSKNAYTNEISEVFNERSAFGVSQVENTSNVHNFTLPTNAKLENIDQYQLIGNPEKTLFANKELGRFFAQDNKQEFKNIDEVELDNRRKTIQFLPKFAFGGEELGVDTDESFSVHRRNSSQNLVNPKLKMVPGLSQTDDLVSSKLTDWKPFVVGDFKRKSMNLEQGDDEEINHSLAQINNASTSQKTKNNNSPEIK